MGYGRLYLALYDAEVFAAAVRDFTRDRDDTGLRAYSDVRLTRTWRYQEFAHWLAEILHDMLGNDTDPFRARLARSRFDRILNKPAGVRWYAEMMTGLG